jgi:beta-galactosidase
MWECKRVFQGVEVERVKDSKDMVRVINRNAVRSLDDFEAHLVLYEDGKILSEKVLPRMTVAAGRDSLLHLGEFIPMLKFGHEYFVSIRFLLKEATPWAEKGFELASNQFAWSPPPATIRQPNVTYPALSTNQEGSGLVVKGKDFTVSFDKKNGALSSYVWKGSEQLFRSFLPHFTRPLTDNDRRGWKSNRKLYQWYTSEPKLVRTDMTPVSQGLVKITSLYSLIHDSAQVRVQWLVNGNGVVAVDYALQVLPGLPNIPKVGMQGGIKRSYDQVSWYGRGPMENYIDRNYGFDVAEYSKKIEDFMEPYAVPQENGNRTDVRWMFFSDNNKEGLLVSADSLLSMSAWPYTEENLENAKHTNMLKDAGYLTVNIDLVQMGVGGNDSWSDVAAPLEKYQVPARAYHYRFYLQPVKLGKEGVGERARGMRF